MDRTCEEISALKKFVKLTVVKIPKETKTTNL